jgi:hypothetical protein
MSIVAKSLSVLALLFLLAFGWCVIAMFHFLYISSKVPVSILGQGRVYTGSWDQGFVAADGTWAIDGEEHAFPLNTSEIRCVKEHRRCYAAGARLSDNYLTADLDFYDVTKWDNSTLEFVTDAACVSYVYVINRNTEKLAGRRVAKTTSDPTCKSIVVSPGLRLSFVSGQDVISKLRSEAAPTMISSAMATIWSALILFWIWRVARKT